MVARITTPGSLQKTLNYNEQKVRKGTAVCIGESGFLLPHNKMNFYEKRDVFEYRNRLNERATSKTLHVSLNFSNSERLDAPILMQIAKDYMEIIGFGEQPFLVYHHKDAGHPHIHILSTTIREDGTRINTHNLGRNQSEIARKFLEDKYHLVKAEKQVRHEHNIQPFDLTKIEYGKSETRRSIASILQQVLQKYNYTSLHELNAVLRQFNVMADRCAEDSFVFAKQGLYYRVLNSSGGKVGVPVKASLLSADATLKGLENLFAKNLGSRPALKEIVKQKIDTAIRANPETITALAALLNRCKINTVLRQNAEGRLYGITFIDNENKVVFNGSEIGRSYSVAGLLKQLSQQADKKGSNDAAHGQSITNKEAGFIEFNGLSAVGQLMMPEAEYNPTPYQLKKQKRKRKR